MAAAPPGLSHSWPDANLLGVRVENHTGLPSVCVGVRVGGFLKLVVLLCLYPCRSALLYIPSPSLLASILPTHPLASRAKPRARYVSRALAPSSGCSPGWACGGALALALAPTLGFAHALLRPGPVLLLKLKLFGTISRFRAPSSVPSVSQIACPSQPMAITARPWQPMAVAARPH